IASYEYNCPLDRQFFAAAGLEAEALREFIATGADDNEVAAWMARHAKMPGEKIIKWGRRFRVNPLWHILDLKDWLPCRWRGRERRSGALSLSALLRLSAIISQYFTPVVKGLSFVLLLLLWIEITTLPEPIGSEHAVRTLRIQAVPRAMFGLPKQFAVRATANQNPQESTPTTSPATMRCLRRGEPQRNNLGAE